MHMEARGGELGLSKVEKLTSVARSCIAAAGSVRPEGEYFVAMEPNSFGLPSVDTCPGKTDYCELDCYAIESEKRTATYLKLQRNLDILEQAGTVEEMTQKLQHLVSGYRERAARLRVPEDKRRFRIHWSGDFFSEDYATAWRKTIEASPEKFFTYTRSYGPNVNVLPILSGLENLDLFLSVDCENVDQAAKVITDAPDARVAYLVDYYEEAEPLIDKMGRRDGFRHLACPENMRDEFGNRKLPIISERGGACSHCTYCIGKSDKWDVIFVKEGLKTRAQGELPFSVPIQIVPRGKKQPQRTQPVGALAMVEAATLF